MFLKRGLITAALWLIGYLLLKADLGGFAAIVFVFALIMTIYTFIGLFSGK